MSTFSNSQEPPPENPLLDSGSGETFTKAEAAQFLGVSSRALERYTAAGRVSVGYQRGKTRSVAVYERAELERLQSELQRPLVRGVPVEASPSGETQTPTQTATNLVNGEISMASVGVQDEKAPLTPTNSDNATSQELVSSAPEAAGDANAGAAGTTLDALAQLILERLMERAHGEAGTSSGTALMLSSAAPVVLKSPHAALGEKLLLSLAEASALTGLSRAFLKAAIRDGALAAKPIGRLWRVKRADLDAFIAAL